MSGKRGRGDLPPADPPESKRVKEAASTAAAKRAAVAASRENAKRYQESLKTKGKATATSARDGGDHGGADSAGAGTPSSAGGKAEHVAASRGRARQWAEQARKSKSSPSATPTAAAASPASSPAAPALPTSTNKRKEREPDERAGGSESGSRQRESSRRRAAEWAGKELGRASKSGPASNASEEDTNGDHGGVDDEMDIDNDGESESEDTAAAGAGGGGTSRPASVNGASASRFNAPAAAAPAAAPGRGEAAPAGWNGSAIGSPAQVLNASARDRGKSSAGITQPSASSLREMTGGGAAYSSPVLPSAPAQAPAPAAANPPSALPRFAEAGNPSEAKAAAASARLRGTRPISVGQRGEGRASATLIAEQRTSSNSIGSNAGGAGVPATAAAVLGAANGSSRRAFGPNLRGLLGLGPPRPVPRDNAIALVLALASAASAVALLVAAAVMALKDAADGPSGIPSWLKLPSLPSLPQMPAASIKSVIRKLGPASHGRICFGVEEASAGPSLQCSEWRPCPEHGTCAGGRLVGCDLPWEMAADEESCPLPADVRDELDFAVRAVHDATLEHRCGTGWWPAGDQKLVSLGEISEARLRQFGAGPSGWLNEVIGDSIELSVTLTDDNETSVQLSERAYGRMPLPLGCMLRVAVASSLRAHSWTFVAVLGLVALLALWEDKKRRRHRLQCLRELFTHEAYRCLLSHASTYPRQPIPVMHLQDAVFDHIARGTGASTVASGADTRSAVMMEACSARLAHFSPTKKRQLLAEAWSGVEERMGADSRVRTVYQTHYGQHNVLCLEWTAHDTAPASAPPVYMPSPPVLLLLSLP